MAELNFSFADKKLGKLAAFMVSEQGHRRIVTADHLDYASKIFLYFHSAAHIALGHVDQEALSITYEIHDRNELQPRSLVREYEADRWVMRLLERRLGQNSDANNAFVERAMEGVRELSVQRGKIRGLLHRLTGILYENYGLYRRLRLRPEVQALLAATYYRCFERLPLERLPTMKEVGSGELSSQ